ncbi:hypothetical protein BASA81_017996 [Batrachochytrium salamandrivorans]|nr:hypothetical protein BASA81_017996 [Batrachochytrium salamandrivorans]
MPVSRMTVLGSVSIVLSSCAVHCSAEATWLRLWCLRASGSELRKSVDTEHYCSIQYIPGRTDPADLVLWQPQGNRSRVSSIITHGPTMMILFAFEYSIMLVVICSIFTKYILHSIDLQNETPWEEKSIYFFYVELTVDFLKLLGYSVFFLTIMHYYSIPLHIVRDLYMTLRSFIRRCGDLIKYHRATANMDQRTRMPQPLS